MERFSANTISSRARTALSWIGWRGQFDIYTAVENNYGLRKHCRIWEGGIPCLFLRWSSAAPAVPRYYLLKIQRVGGEYGITQRRLRVSLPAPSPRSCESGIPCLSSAGPPLLQRSASTVQEDSSLADSKASASGPISAMIWTPELTPKPGTSANRWRASRSEEHTSELQSLRHL